MKRNVFSLVITIILLVILIGGMALVLQPKSATSVTTDNQTLRNTVTVSGEGKVFAPADEASITFGVTTVRSTASRAMNDNSAVITKVIAALRSKGLSSDEISTGNVSLVPQQDWQQGHAPRILSYTATNQVIVRTKKLDTLGAIIDAATTAGATDVSELRFLLSEDNKAKQDALKIAVQNAKKQAQTLAGELDAGIGNPVIVNASTQQSSLPILYNDMAHSLAAEKSIAPPVMPQDLEINVSVTVSYELK